MLRNSDKTSPSSGAANTRRFYTRDLRSALPHCQAKPWERQSHNFQSCQTRVIWSSSCSMQSCNDMWYFVAWTLIYGNTFQSGSWALPSDGSLCSNPNLIFKNTQASPQHTGIPRFGGLIFGPWKMKKITLVLECWAAEPATSPVLTFLGTLHLVRHASDLWPVGTCFSNERIPLTVMVMVLQTIFVYFFLTFFHHFVIYEFCTCLKIWLWLQQLQLDWGTRRFGIITGCFRQLCSVF